MKVWRPQFEIYFIIRNIHTHFHLDGFVNRQNCYVWGSEKPRVIGEKQTHPQRVTVWRGFWPGGVVGPCFFENEAGRAATVMVLNITTR